MYKRKSVEERLINHHLVTDERIFKWTRRHWFSLITRIWKHIVVIIAVIIPISITQLLPVVPKQYATFAAIVSLVTITHALVSWYGWAQRVYVVTNKRVLKVGGVIEQLAPTDKMSLRVIQDIDSSVGKGFLRIIGGLFGMRETQLQSGVSNLELVEAPSWLEQAIWEAKEDDITESGEPPAPYPLPRVKV